MFNRKPKLEFRPLPMNIPEFNDWAARIISIAQLPTKNTETQRFALAGMILQTAPHDFFRPDEYYMNLLRKSASDQLAMQVMQDIKAERIKREEELKKQQSEATLNKGVADEEKGKC